MGVRKYITWKKGKKGRNIFIPKISRLLGRKSRWKEWKKA